MVINYEQMNKSNHQNVNIVITDVKKIYCTSARTSYVLGGKWLK